MRTLAAGLRRPAAPIICAVRGGRPSRPAPRPLPPPPPRPIRRPEPAPPSRARQGSPSGFELFLSPCDEFLQLLVDARVDAWIRILRQQLLPALSRHLVSGPGTHAVPAVVVLGRRDPRPVEARAVVTKRVLRAKEMTAGTDLAQRIHRHPLFVDGQSLLQHPLEHAQRFD